MLNSKNLNTKRHFEASLVLVGSRTGIGDVPNSEINSHHSATLQSFRITLKIQLFDQPYMYVMVEVSSVKISEFLNVHCKL